MIPAHIRKNGDFIEEQLVKVHLENVGKLCSIYGEKASIKFLALLVGLLHDIGKLTLIFREHIYNSFMNPEKSIQGPDHSTAGAIWIMSLIDNNSKEIERLTAQLISIVIMSHHGGLVDIFDESGESPYLRRLDKIINNEEYYKIYKEAIENLEKILDTKYLKGLFNNAVKEVENFLIKTKESNQEINYAVGVLCKYLFSCLIDADRYDTATFMDGENIAKPKDSLELWKIFSDRLERRIRDFPEDTHINILRNKISKSCVDNATKNTGIYTLNCPTGSGKTFSSLRFALNHAKEHNKDRIFYIIPYISITDQNSIEIKRILSEQDKDELVENSIIELHSAKESDENIDEKQLKKAELVAERMDSPIILTTMVRFLNTFFANGTRNIRAAHNFANSIIIFDEVQTISTKFFAMFNGLLNFLVNVCNTTIVLSTATQPLLNETPETIKPLQLENNPEISGMTQEMINMFKRTVFIDKTKIGTKEYLSQLIWNEASLEGNSLVVLNTKASVVALYYEFIERYVESIEYEGFSLYVLTTNLCAAHRKVLINKIKNKLKNNQKVIVISTPLIEAGVDISFKCVFRAIAGMDSIIQSAGRCNRHGENGIECHGKVYLIKPDFEELGNLRDIKRGKNATERILYHFNSNPKAMSNDLSSIDALNTYFKVYYQEQKDNMTYRFKKDKREFLMYDLLNSNSKIKCEAYSNLGIKKDKRAIISQSFKFAANNFKAIDEYGISVIVPYGEGKDIICKLLSSNKNSNTLKLLKKVQQYNVNINEDTFKKLKDVISFYEDIGIYILNENYYDKTLGVVINLTNYEVYCF